MTIWGIIWLVNNNYYFIYTDARHRHLVQQHIGSNIYIPLEIFEGTIQKFNFTT